MTMKWILREDGALCLAGYPIRIKRGGSMRFLVESDWHNSSTPYMTVSGAKAGAERLAEEIREFTAAEER